MSQERSFGYWLKRSRKALDLTQADLAKQVGCSAETIRKLEAEERRPSAQIAGRLAEILRVPRGERDGFLRFARGDWRSAPDGVMETIPWRISEKSPPASLPSTTTSFVGREKEVSLVRGYLLNPEIRLVTLTGPPGIGKTRLSIEAAHGLLSHFPEGMFFVALAPLQDPALMVQTVAQALGYVETRHQPVDEQLTAGIGSRTLLIVLDNCEHMIEEISAFASRLLSACPYLKILATSREALRIPGEWIYTVPAIRSPSENSPIDVETAAAFPALTLFAQRARAVRSDFELNAGNLPLIAAICARLDGLPLAIELMAARMRMMSPQTLLDHLDHDFVLSANGMRPLSSRHKTLKDAIRWSYHLLLSEEQRVFACLSVFSGGFTLETAEVTFSGIFPGRSIAGLITSLWDKSLLQQTQDPGGEVRFYMLDTIQEFARVCLREMDREKEARDLHLRCFASLARQARPHLRSAHQILWLDRLEMELDNIRAALTWSLESGAIADGLELATDLEMFWIYRAHIHESCLVIENLLNATLPDSKPAVLFHGHLAAGYLQMFLGNLEAGHAHGKEAERLCLQFEALDGANLAEARNLLVYTDLDFLQDQGRARQAFEENLKLLQETGNRWLIAHTTFNLGTVLLNSGSLTETRETIERSLALFLECGDRIRVGQQKAYLALIDFEECKYAEAGTGFEEALSFYRQASFNLEIDFLLYMLGMVALRQGSHNRAQTWYTGCLLFIQKIGIDSLLPECLIGFAAIACAGERFEQSARLIGAAEARIETMQTPIGKTGRAELQQLTSLLCEAVGESKFKAWSGESRAMTMEQAIAYALEC